MRKTKSRKWRTARWISVMTICQPPWNGRQPGGEPVDVIAIHLDYDDSDNSPYYEVKLLCNDEDLAGAPIAIREQQRRASP
jgi:hypothetical protein